MYSQVPHKVVLNRYVSPPHRAGGHSGLGLVSSAKRQVQSGLQYDHLIPRASGTEKTIHKHSTNYQTLLDIIATVAEYQWQVKKLAPKLKRATQLQTIQAVFDFVYRHFNYKEDPRDREQLKTPRSSWANRFTGIDCDDATILIGALLNELGIIWYPKMIQQKGFPGFHHVYPIVPKAGGYYTLDFVPYPGGFDHEPGNIKNSYVEMKTTVLDGLGQTGNGLNGRSERQQAAKDIVNICQTELSNVLKDRTGENGFQYDLYRELFGMNYNRYVDTVRSIEKSAANGITSGLAFAQRLKGWDTKITGLVDRKIAEEKYGLQRSKIGVVAVMRDAGIIEDLQGKKFTNFLNKALEFILRVSPTTAILRKGVLFSVENNASITGRSLLASKMYPVLLSEQQAINEGYTKERYNTTKAQYSNTLEKLVVVGVRDQELKDAIRKGHERALKNGYVQKGQKPADKPTKIIISPNDKPSKENINHTPGAGGPPGGLGAVEPASAAILSASALVITAIAALYSTVKADPENIKVDTIIVPGQGNGGGNGGDGGGDGGDGGSGGGDGGFDPEGDFNLTPPGDGFIPPAGGGNPDDDDDSTGGISMSTVLLFGGAALLLSSVGGSNNNNSLNGPVEVTLGEDN